MSRNETFGGTNGEISVIKQGKGGNKFGFDPNNKGNKQPYMCFKCRSNAYPVLDSHQGQGAWIMTGRVQAAVQ